MNAKKKKYTQLQTTHTAETNPRYERQITNQIGVKHDVMEGFRKENPSRKPQLKREEDHRDFRARGSEERSGVG